MKLLEKSMTLTLLLCSIMPINSLAKNHSYGELLKISQSNVSVPSWMNVIGEHAPSNSFIENRVYKDTYYPKYRYGYFLPHIVLCNNGREHCLLLSTSMY